MQVGVGIAQPAEIRPPEARLVAEPGLRIVRRHDLHARPRHSSRLRIISRRGAAAPPRRSFPALRARDSFASRHRSCPDSSYQYC